MLSANIGDGFERYTGTSRENKSELRITTSGALYIKRTFLTGDEKTYDVYYDRAKGVIALNLRGTDRKFTISKGGVWAMLKSFLKHFDIPHPVNCEVWEKEGGVIFLKPKSPPEESSKSAFPFGWLEEYLLTLTYI